MTEPKDLFFAELGKRLKALRLQADITTQRELTDRLADLGVHYDYTTVSHWEKGRRRPSLETLIAIIQVLVRAGSIRDVEEANELLRLADMRDLSQNEATQIFGNLHFIREQKTSTLVLEDRNKPSIASSPLVTPLYLPPKAYHRLIGRFDELDRVIDGLRDPERKPITAIVGLGGIGKTALAREVAERCRQEKLFDRIVWATAKTERFVGEGAVKTEVSDYCFDELLGDIGRQCDRMDIAKMPLNQKKAAVKYLLATKRLLIVMDNLETVLESEKLIDDVFQILGKSKLLITSRHRVRHERVFPINLGGFPQDEGIAFLREESEERGITVVAQAPHSNLIEIHQITGGAPLAMKLVVGQMGRLSMPKVLRTLKEAGFEGQDYAFYRFVFKHSWDMLISDAKKVLVSMSAFAPIIGGTEEAVRTVSAVEGPTFHRALDQLVLMSLVDSLGDLEHRRYAIHQLTNYFILSDIVKKWG